MRASPAAPTVAGGTAPASPRLPDGPRRRARLPASQRIGNNTRMQLSLRGVPIHTRALAIELRAAAGDAVAFAGTLLDLRKRGFVPVGGDLQGTGIIHHMQIAGEIDRAAAAIRTIEARMPSVAFEASAATRGESCRDPIASVARIAGTELSAGFAKSIGVEIGGPRGCSHVLTLTQLLGPTATWAFAEDERTHGRVARRGGERIFRRDVTVDGAATGAGELDLALQVNDLLFRPSPDLAPAAERFAAQTEIRVAATLAIGDLRLSSIAIAERRRTRESFESAPWVKRPDRAESVAGASLRAGITGHLLRAMPEPGRDQPILDALLMLAPATVQCFASFSDTWTQIPWGDGDSARETGGYPDSCYMWRRDGALGRRG
jgi:hypothetical protein